MQFPFTTSDSATIVNQVQRGFNGLGQITSEAQGHTSAGAGSAPTVTYTYTEMSKGANHSRMTTLTYPMDLSPASTLTFNYSGGDDSISRLSSISDGTDTLESYSYLGLGTVIKRVHPQPDLELTYIGSAADAGDQYAGLDRFGRVVDQLWNDGNTVTFDRFQYTYDENGNRLTRNIVMAGAGSSDNYDEKYTYDGLNQLTQFDRGVLSGGSIASVLRQQTWDPDAVGNFTSMTTTVTGSSTVTENRDHNRQNQLNSVTITGASTTTLTYDNAGSTTKSVFDDGKSPTTTTFTFDAWNRMVEFKGSARYAYDAIGRRIKEDTRALFYSKDWQVLEERSGGAVLYRYAWSPVYVDAMIARDEFSGGSFTGRVYALADANFNVTALMAYISSSWQIAERYVYDPYGAFTKLSSTWGTYAGSERKWVYLHQGGRWDGDVGKYHFRRRDYDSALMRWVEVDPIGFDGNDSNLFRYEFNQPLIYIDPYGEKCAPPAVDIPKNDPVWDTISKCKLAKDQLAQCRKNVPNVSFCRSPGADLGASFENNEVRIHQNEVGLKLLDNLIFEIIRCARSTNKKNQELNKRCFLGTISRDEYIKERERESWEAAKIISEISVTCKDVFGGAIRSDAASYLKGGKYEKFEDFFKSQADVIKKHREDVGKDWDKYCDPKNPNRPGGRPKGC